MCDTPPTILIVQHLEHLRLIKETAVISPIAEGVQHSDNYVVIVQNSLEKPSSVKAEHVNIRYGYSILCIALHSDIFLYLFELEEALI